MSAADLLRPRRNWALFLDLDGTLLDIAERPDAVVVPDGLRQSLLSASRCLGGALALVSGRTLGDIDRLLSPLRLPCGAEHGGTLRMPDGAIQMRGPDHVAPAKMRAGLHAAAQAWPGTLVEEKRFNIVVHFRGAPEREAEIRQFALALAAEAGPEFEALRANKAFEIRHRGLHKGAVVTAFMEKAPFASRFPVFVGDDVTDEDGFAATRALGGLALNVRVAFEGSPARVRRWLGAFCP